MSIWVWLLIAYLLWSIIGFVHFITSLGRKTGPDTLMDKLMYPPVMVIAHILGFITWLRRKN